MHLLLKKNGGFDIILIKRGELGLMKTRVKAYAKINLHLDVTGLRDDGYHNVETVMQSISLSDTVDIELIDGEKIVIECDKIGVPLGEKNIAYKAARLFFDEIGRMSGVRIKIKKNIPMAAGMAGGSADAAATLVGLNELFDKELDNNKLLALGSKLGADVPFCIQCGCAYSDGRGDNLTELTPINEKFILVAACGGEGVSTPMAYRLLDEKYDRFTDYNKRDINALFESLANKDSGFYKHLFNIFEEPISAERKAVLEIKSDMLQSGALAALMSGSGPSVFGVFDDMNAAEGAVAKLCGKGYFAGLAFSTQKRIF